MRTPARVCSLHRALLTCACLLSLAPLGCASNPNDPAIPESARAGRVTGKVYYLQRIAVPPNAKLSVTLLDVTDLNRPRTLAEQSQAVSAVPVNYELRFNPASIHEGRIYQVKAELTMSEGKVWTHTKAYPVLTGNAPAYAEIVVGPQ